MKSRDSECPGTMCEGHDDCDERAAPITHLCTKCHSSFEAVARKGGQFCPRCNYMAGPLRPASITKAQMDEKRMLADAGCDMTARTYLALDEAARKAFEALRELLGGALDRDEEDVIDADRAWKAMERGRAALPQGWEK